MKKNILMIGVLLSCSFFVAMEQDLSSGKEEEEQVTDQFREAIDRIVSESSTKEEAFERLKSYGERALIGRSDAFLKASLIRLYDKFLWNKDISYTINAARGFKEELALDPEKANRILYGLIHLIVKNSLRDAIEFDLAFSRKIESPLAYQSFITLLRNNVAEEEMEEYFDELFAFASEDVQDREFTDLFTRHAQAAILIMPSLFERGLEVDKDKIILPLHHLVIEGTPPLLRTALQSPLSNSVQLAPSIRPQHLNAKNDEGMTPLHLALFLQSIDGSSIAGLRI